MKRPYRFAILGLAGSGKTNLLAALTMPSAPDPSGFGSSWQRRPPGRHSRGRKAYVVGSEAIDAAVKALREGRLPAPTKLQHRVMRLRFRFSVSGPEPHSYPVELIDYSGEVLDPEAKGDELIATLEGP